MKRLLSESHLLRTTADDLEYLYGEGRASRADVVAWVRLSAKRSGRVYEPVYSSGGKFGERLRLLRREDVEDRMFSKRVGYYKRDARQTRRDILTDRRGRPIEKPRRSDYASDSQYLHAFHAYKDQIAREANAGFDEGWRSATSKGRGRKKRASSRDCYGLHFHSPHPYMSRDQAREKLSREQRSRLADKIRVLRREGYPERQAVAIAFHMLRSGQI